MPCTENSPNLESRRRTVFVPTFMTNPTDIEIATEARFGDAPILIFCDHASNAMPASFDCLGLPQDILATHIAWDIGAGAVAEGLARQLGAAFLSCGFSRLLIDANRDVSSSDIIPAVADQIPVPGNQMLTDADRAARVRDFHEPYHRRLAAAIDALATNHKDPIAISVHSFTNRLMGAGDERPWGLGLLWREDERSAKFTIDWLRDNADWPIGDNEPYDARLFNYSVDRHIGPRGMRHLTFEVRQDLVADADGVAKIADILARSVGALNKNHIG